MIFFSFWRLYRNPNCQISLPACSRGSFFKSSRRDGTSTLFSSGLNETWLPLWPLSKNKFNVTEVWKLLKWHKLLKYISSAIFYGILELAVVLLGDNIWENSISVSVLVSQDSEIGFDSQLIWKRICLSKLHELRLAMHNDTTLTLTNGQDLWSRCNYQYLGTISNVTHVGLAHV